MWIVEHLENCEGEAIDTIESEGFEIDENLPFNFLAIELTEEEASGILSYPYIKGIEREIEFTLDENS